MDERTVAMMDGHTAVLAEILKLLVSKGILSADEIREVVAELVAKAIEDGAQPGFEAVPVHLLRIIERWNVTHNHRGTPS